MTDRAIKKRREHRDSLKQPRPRIEVLREKFILLIAPCVPIEFETRAWEWIRMVMHHHGGSEDVPIDPTQRRLYAGFAGLTIGQIGRNNRTEADKRIAELKETLPADDHDILDAGFAYTIAGGDFSLNQIVQ